jgi:valyl-tRNA synthetase
MLHPFMPFITEEIWQQMPRSKDAKGGSIMIQPWPHMQKEMVSEKAEAEVKYLIDAITAIRNIRSVWNIEPRLEMKAFINVSEKKDQKFLSDNEGFLKRLSRLSEFSVGTMAKPANSAVTVVGNLEIYVPLEGLIDLEKEKERLKKEEDRINNEIKAISARLKDKNFTLKAPKEVVERQRARKTELELQINKLKDNLSHLAAG